MLPSNRRFSTLGVPVGAFSAIAFWHLFEDILLESTRLSKFTPNMYTDVVKKTVHDRGREVDRVILSDPLFL